MCDGWVGDTLVLELYCVGQALVLGVLDVARMRPIVFCRGEEVPSIDGMIRPRASLVCLLMHLCIASHWSKRHFVVVERSTEVCIC